MLVLRCLLSHWAKTKKKRRGKSKGVKAKQRAQMAAKLGKGGGPADVWGIASGLEC